MRPGVVLSLDVGSKTIGLAVTDPERRMAFPLKTLARQSVAKDAEALEKLCRERGVTQIVVGLPLELNGEEGRTARLARQVADAIVARTQLPLAWVDERFSTVEAERYLREAGLNSRQQRGVIDAQAATVILDDWLDSIRAASTEIPR